MTKFIHSQKLQIHRIIHRIYTFTEFTQNSQIHRIHKFTEFTNSQNSYSHRIHKVTEFTKSQNSQCHRIHKVTEFTKSQNSHDSQNSQIDILHKFTEYIVRLKLIFPYSPGRAGNGRCDPECNTRACGNDGGDCEQPEPPTNGYLPPAQPGYSG